MEIFRRYSFFFSTPALLKLAEFVVLLTSMILFLAENRCPSYVAFVTMFVLPCSVCCMATLVSYATAVLVMVGGRNPLTTPTFVKGDVLLNVSATLVMLVGSIITLTYKECINFSGTLAALALSFISVILFAISGAVTYMVLFRHQHQVKEIQRAQLTPGRINLNEMT